jgi:outer membrane lipoprotein-sorting protein
MVLTPEDAEGQSTELRYLDIEFDVPIPDDTFSLSRRETAR